MTAHRRGHRRADHDVTRAVAQASPGAWILAATYPVGGSSAEATARDVRAGRRGYGPPGTYDARILPYGQHQEQTALEVRYLGGAS